jgi:hypothetical protein
MNLHHAAALAIVGWYPDSESLPEATRFAMTGWRREVDSNSRDSFWIRWAEFVTNFAQYSAIQKASVLER